MIDRICLPHLSTCQAAQLKPAQALEISDNFFVAGYQDRRSPEKTCWHTDPVVNPTNIVSIPTNIVEIPTKLACSQPAYADAGVQYSSISRDMRSIIATKKDGR